MKAGDLVQYDRGSVYCGEKAAGSIGTILSTVEVGYAKVYWLDIQRTIWERLKDIQPLADIKCPGENAST